ncbi:MAG: SdrD B-like domain-containing protein [Thermoguttaceae bacterium]
MMFLRKLRRRLVDKQSSRSSRFLTGRRLNLEPLEDRRLLALVGVSPAFPTITYDAQGPLSYDADAQALTFELSATPLQFRQSSATPNRAISTPSSFHISIYVDNQGQLLGGSSGSDLIVTGNIDVNGDGVIDYSGTLLTGEVTQFGYSDSGTTTDLFDFRFTPTGGALASLYSGKDIGVKTTSESSTFAGSFATSFVGYVKGTLGSVSARWSSLAGYVYNDADGDGVRQTSEAGIAGVTIQLTGTDIGGNAVSLMTVTDSLGAYTFSQLRPGTYSVTEVQPAGWLDGLDTQGTPGTGVAGQDVLADIVLSAGVNGLENNFGELTMSPGISLVKLTNVTTPHGTTTGDNTYTPSVPAGSSITWIYGIENTGNVPLSNVTLTDNQGVVLTGPVGDVNENGILDVGESWTYAATGTAIAGSYTNTATATGTATDATGTVSTVVIAEDSNSYFGVAPEIAVTKTTNDTNNPSVETGSTVTWTYTVTNTGNVSLSDVTVTDEQGVTPVYVSGDDGNGLLDQGEVWTYTATGVAIVGAYTATATATGTDVTDTVSTPVSAQDTDGYFGVQPGISIVKLTNGTDNANPYVAAGSTVTWNYYVTNTGNVALAAVAVSDDTAGVTPFYYTGDDGNGLLDVGETWVYAAIGTAVVGPYTNTGTVTGTDSTGIVATPVCASETDSYFGVSTGVAIVKLTNGMDNANELLTPGTTVTWTYQVTNTGNAALTAVAVTDSDATVTPVYSSGDDGNGLLDAGETWVYTAAGVAVAGQYANTGTVTAADATGAVAGAVTASEGDSYFGVQPGICIVKLTNGSDHNDAPGAQVIEGSVITWTYEVTNTGNVALTGVTVVDSDSSVTPVYESGDTDLDGQLDVDEIWVYAASGTAILGQYSNTGTVAGSDATGTVSGVVTASDVDYYYGAAQTPATKSGYVYVDANNDGIKQSGEVGIKGVKIILTGVNDLGQSVNITTTTDANGYYLFSNLRPGTYSVSEVQPTGSSSTGYGDHKAYMYQWYEHGVRHFELHNRDGSIRKYDVAANCSALDSIFSELDDQCWTSDSVNWNDQDVCEALFRRIDATQTCASDGEYFLRYFSDFWNGVHVICGQSSTLYLDGKDTAGSDGGTAGNDVISDIVLNWGDNGTDNNFGELLPASVSGSVYVDSNNDGAQQCTENGIAGVVVTLTGVDDLGNTVNLTVVTDRNGGYEFGNLRPGTYTLTESQPTSYLDGTDSAGAQGGTAGDDVISGIVLSSGLKATGNKFGELKPSSLSGFVYLDKNSNGDIDCRDLAIAGVTVTLTGVDDRGNAVSLTTVTDDDGAYSFTNLRPGTYTITETQPAGFIDGVDTIGSQGGIVGNDQFTGIVLQAGVRGINNNFAELQEASATLHHGQTATIGFWNNKRGQALINSLNGGSSSTQLGNWLATMFPNMYGASAATHNLAGKTNAQIAAFFKELFNVRGMKIDAQALAVCLAVYVTNSNLAGNVAASYGFVVSSTGTGSATFNIGSSGEAFNVADNSTLSIMAILQLTNDQTKKGILWDLNGNGTVSSAEQVLRSMANNILTAINETGDIG